MSFVKTSNKLNYTQSLELTCNKFRDECKRLVEAHRLESDTWKKLDLWQQYIDISEMELFFNHIFMRDIVNV